MRICSECKTLKEICDYPKTGSKMCKKCKNKRDYQRRDKNKIKENSDNYRLKKGHKPREEREDGLKKGSVEYSREYNLKSKYGISCKEYDELIKKQDSKCGICGLHIDNYKLDNFSVDHCHSTFKVRGLLCNNCNIGLGMFKDNEDILKRAIEYLR